MRNKGLDVIKWIAIIAMVIDHLRFIDFISALGYNNTLTIIGRFAFPMFCFVMAVNFKRIIENNNNDAIKSYLINLSIFSFISEIPYRLLEKTPHVLNVMPTLFLGMLLMVILVKNYKHKWLVIVTFFSFAVPFSPLFMYGLLGILLPICCYVALVYKNKWLYLLPVVIAPLCNLQYFVHTISTVGFILPVALIGFSAMLSIVFSFLILYKEIKFKIWKVGAWGYAFYPVHLLTFHIINKLMQ